jgi:hypothetical protein
MASHQVMSYSSGEALKIYRELGELTPDELSGLHHSYSHVGRLSYFRNIYGYHAGAIARGVYERWADAHDSEACKACKQATNLV